MPGMTASATIFIDEKENTLILSGKALRFTPSQAYLQKMFAEGAASGKFKGRSGGSFRNPGASPGQQPGSSDVASNIPSGAATPRHVPPMTGAGFFLFRERWF